MKNQQRLFVVSGPSGVGKDTVVSVLRKQHPEIAKTVSATTRAPRKGEREGVDYYYVTVERFLQIIEEKGVVEYNVYNGNYYGTLRSEVNAHLDAGEAVLLVIDVHGAANIKKLYPDALTIFICPPSTEELEKRLRSRGTETDEQVIQGRLKTAREELALAPSYDVTVINEEIDRCAAQLYDLMRPRMEG